MLLAFYITSNTSALANGGKRRITRCRLNWISLFTIPDMADGQRWTAECISWWGQESRSTAILVLIAFEQRGQIEKLTPSLPSVAPKDAPILCPPSDS